MYKLLIYKVKQSNCNFPLILAFITLFSLAGFLRLAEIYNIGVIDYDEFRYLQVGKWWTEGNFTLGGYYRPAIYFLDSFAIRFFGYHDYSLNLLNSLMDIINIFLIFFITNLITNNKWLGISASSLYAFSPGIIDFSRSSYVHIPSVTFVLGSFFFYLKFDNFVTRGPKRSVIYLALSGLFNSIATHIHPDLAFFAPIYVFLIFFSLKKREIIDKTNLIKQWIIYAAVFSLSFFSLYFISGLYYGFNKIVQILIWERSHDAQNITQIQLFTRILNDSVVNNTLELIPLLFLGSLLIIVYQKSRQEEVLLSYLVSPFLVLGYGLLGSIILTQYIDRLAIPLIPFIVISITIWFYKVIKLVVKDNNTAVLIIYIISLIITGYNLNPFREEFIESIVPEQKYFRQVYNVMKYKIDKNNRMLITPYIIYSYVKGFQAPFYFGANTIYIIDYPYSNKTLEELVKEEKIKFIYIASDLKYDFRILEDNDYWIPEIFISQARHSIPVDFYGLRLVEWNDGYSVKKELKILYNFLKRNKVQKIYSSVDGEIYKLNI